MTIREKRAYTFVELVVAMAIAAVWLASLFGMLIVMGRYEEGSRLSAAAVLCAQERMEELRFAVERDALVPAQGRESLLVGPYKNMERSWAVEPSSVHTGLKEVEVECTYSWQGEMRKENLLSLVNTGG